MNTISYDEVITEAISFFNEGRYSEKAYVFIIKRHMNGETCWLGLVKQGNVDICQTTATTKEDVKKQLKQLYKTWLTEALYAIERY